MDIAYSNYGYHFELRISINKNGYPKIKWISLIRIMEVINSNIGINNKTAPHKDEQRNDETNIIVTQPM